MLLYIYCKTYGNREGEQAWGVLRMRRAVSNVATRILSRCPLLDPRMPTVTRKRFWILAPSRKSGCPDLLDRPKCRRLGFAASRPGTKTSRFIQAAFVVDSSSSIDFALITSLHSKTRYLLITVNYVVLTLFLSEK